MFSDLISYTCQEYGEVLTFPKQKEFIYNTFRDKRMCKELKGATLYTQLYVKVKSLLFKDVGKKNNVLIIGNFQMGLKNSLFTAIHNNWNISHFKLTIVFFNISVKVKELYSDWTFI